MPMSGEPILRPHAILKPTLAPYPRMIRGVLVFSSKILILSFGLRGVSPLSPLSKGWPYSIPIGIAAFRAGAGGVVKALLYS